MRSQFHTVLDAHPDNIMISSFNEFIAQVCTTIVPLLPLNLTQTVCTVPSSASSQPFQLPLCLFHGLATRPTRVQLSRPHSRSLPSCTLDLSPRAPSASSHSHPLAHILISSTQQRPVGGHLWLVHWPRH